MKEKVEWLGNVCLTVTRENPNQGRVYRKEAICPCLNAMRGGATGNRSSLWRWKMEKIIVAMRGRYKSEGGLPRS